jgi:hypothetical protein
MVQPDLGAPAGEKMTGVRVVSRQENVAFPIQRLLAIQIAAAFPQPAYTPKTTEPVAAVFEVKDP